MGQVKLASTAVVAKPEMTPREAGLFFRDLFAKLHVHSKDAVLPGMVHFCLAKANRLAHHLEITSLEENGDALGVRVKQPCEGGTGLKVGLHLFKGLGGVVLRQDNLYRDVRR